MIFVFFFLGGRWFSKILRNIWGWYVKILTIPYSGRWVVWKRPKTPLRNIMMAPSKENKYYIPFAKMQWQKKSVIFGWIVKKAILTDKLFRAHDIPIFYVFCILPYFSSICLFLFLVQKCKCYCISRRNMNGNKLKTNALSL